MEEAKAFKLAGRTVYANDPRINYEFCKKYVVCCPNCKQWLHYKEYKEGIRQPHFAHYDLPDKDCDQRSKSGGGTTRGNSVSRDQRLAVYQQQFESFFIDYSKYQNKVLEECSSVVQKYVEWFLLEETKQSIFSSYDNEQYEDFCYLTISLLSLDSNQSVLEKVIAYAIKKSFNQDQDSEIKKNIIDIIIQGINNNITESETIGRENGYPDSLQSTENNEKTKYVSKENSSLYGKLSNQNKQRKERKNKIKVAEVFDSGQEKASSLVVNYSSKQETSETLVNRDYIEIASNTNYIVTFFPIKTREEKGIYVYDIPPLVKDYLKSKGRYRQGKNIYPLGFLKYRERGIPKHYYLGILTTRFKMVKSEDGKRLQKSIAYLPMEEVKQGNKIVARTSETIAKLKYEKHEEKMRMIVQSSLDGGSAGNVKTPPIEVLEILTALRIDFTGDVLATYCNDMALGSDKRSLNWVELLKPLVKIQLAKTFTDLMEIVD